MRVFVFSALSSLVAGHGVMTIPMSRNGGDPAHPASYYTTMYYTAPTRKVGPVKITDRDLLTEFRYGTDDRPWRAPGTAPVWSPCGMYCDNCGSPGGKDGNSLSETPLTKWKVGSTVEVGFGMNTNHGGGYSYRLCKKGRPQTEACFQENYLDFVGDKSWVQKREHRNQRTEIAAKRTKLGIGGSMWTKNPVPNNCNGADCPFPPPMPGLYGHTHQTNTRMLEEINIVDKVKIPATLSLGKYTLSWRWDCEETTQVWLNCADVEIVCKTCDATPLPTPSPSPSPFPSPSPTVGGGACSSDTKDCSSTKCCSSPSRKCYRKDKYWAGCVEQCTPGQKQAADPPQYRTPWECKLLDESPPAPAPRPAPPSGGGGQPEPEPEEEPEAEPEAEDESESEGVCTANLGPKQACVPKKMKKYCTNANSKYHPWVMKNCCMACKAVLLELHARKPVGETKFSNRMVAQVDSHGALDID